MTRKQRLAATQKRIMERTAQIVVGDTYFISSFYDTDGAMVKVLETSTEQNSCGWNSTVSYEVIEPIGDEIGKTYGSRPGLYAVPGMTGTCNATNLYENRADASPSRKAQRSY